MAPRLYDFGPAVVAQVSPAPTGRPVLALRVQASPALEGTSLFYRLAYADSQEMRAYTLARWTMSPGELVQQRLRAGLARDFDVLRPGEGAPRVLHIDLDEFSQVYASATQSSGLLHLRATVLQLTPGGEHLLAQRELLLSRPVAAANAAAGVHALTAATDAAVQELRQWLQALH